MAYTNTTPNNSNKEVDHEKLLSDPLQHCPDFKFDWG